MRDVEVGEDESRNHASAAEQKAIFCSAAGCRGDERLVSGFQLFDFHTPRPLQNLPLSQFSPIYTLRRMNIFDRKMPLEVIFE